MGWMWGWDGGMGTPGNTDHDKKTGSICVILHRYPRLITQECIQNPSTSAEGIFLQYWGGIFENGQKNTAKLMYLVGATPVHRGLHKLIIIDKSVNIAPAERGPVRDFVDFH